MYLQRLYHTFSRLSTVFAYIFFFFITKHLPFYFFARIMIKKEKGMKRLIDAGKKQFKANLHCHSNLSDGKWSPEKIKQEYKKRGYAVVCITDHERLVNHSDLTDSEILFLTGYEAYIRTMPFNGITDEQAHINFYSRTPDNKMVYYTPNHTKYIPARELKNLQYHFFVERRQYDVEFVKKMIEDGKKSGYIVCHNHPSWSFEGEAFAEAYEGCFAMEIYNHSSHVGGHIDYDRAYYEHQLKKGRKTALIAADDNHNGAPIESPYSDAFGGFTYILADELSYDSVFSALETKNFYASTGPQIYSLTADKGKFRILSSEAKRIVFSTNTRHRSVYYAEEKPLTEAEFKLGEYDEWVRVEVVDEKGKIAFTRAYFKEDWK